MSERALSNTAYVILGFLDAEPRSGYEIKQAVDNTTRFFWAASYGQIYPELRRLRDEGLVESERDDTGGRKRKVHRITEAGRRALREWLAEPALATELRDEKLLKLFFSTSAGGADEGREAGVEALEARAAEHTEIEQRLRELEPMVLAKGDSAKLAVLRYGIELNAWGRRHCEEAANEMRRTGRRSA
ncbi:MAG: helix-turn-helix transcriptional regulator [Solirubrobacterales bacterium]